MNHSRLLCYGRLRPTYFHTRPSYAPQLRRLYTSSPPESEKPTSHQTSRLPAVLALTAVTGIVSTYFLWPSKSRSAPTSSDAPISASHFTPVALIATEPAGPNAKIIVLNIPRSSLPQSSDDTLLNPIWSIFIKDDDIQVERPYTPLEGIDEQGNMRFWVKKYPRGEVGRWLHSKHIGDTVEIRGPLSTFRHLPESFEEVVMVSAMFACHTPCSDPHKLEDIRRNRVLTFLSTAPSRAPSRFKTISHAVHITAFLQKPRGTSTSRTPAASSSRSQRTPGTSTDWSLR